MHLAVKFITSASSQNCPHKCGPASQVARGNIIPFFNDIFDALCKLSADADPNVQVRVNMQYYDSPSSCL